MGEEFSHSKLDCNFLVLQIRTFFLRFGVSRWGNSPITLAAACCDRGPLSAEAKQLSAALVTWSPVPQLLPAVRIYFAPSSGQQPITGAGASPIWRLFEVPKKTPSDIHHEKGRTTDTRSSPSTRHSPPTPLPHNMSLSCRYAAQCCARQLRTPTMRVVSSSMVQQRMSRRHNSTEAATNPKIAAIVDQISQLTLLETADLVSSLKVASFRPGSACMGLL